MVWAIPPGNGEQRLISHALLPTKKRPSRSLIFWRLSCLVFRVRRTHVEPRKIWAQWERGQKYTGWRERKETYQNQNNLYYAASWARETANTQATGLQPERQTADEDDSETMIACKLWDSAWRHSHGLVALRERAAMAPPKKICFKMLGSENIVSPLLYMQTGPDQKNQLASEHRNMHMEGV